MMDKIGSIKQMLEYHLNQSIDASSRNKGFIERSVEWMVSRFEVDKNSEIADFGCGPGLYTNMLAEHRDSNRWSATWERKFAWWNFKIRIEPIFLA